MLTRSRDRIEAQIADVRAQICAPGNTTAARSSGLESRRRARGESVDLVRDALRVLQEAGCPLGCSEVARRIGVERHIAQYRLDRAVELRFAEKVEGGRYRVVEAVAGVSA